MNDEKFKLADQRTEEVQSIIERMPTRFGFWVTMIVLFLFTLMFVFGWVVRYPDVIAGQIILNANASPLKLIANSNGKIKLNHVKSMDLVKEGQVVAYVENPTNLQNVVFLDSLLKLYNPNSDKIQEIQSRLPHNFSLGELNVKYYAFLSSMQEFINYKQDRLFDKQGEDYIELLGEQKKAVLVAIKRIIMEKNSLDYAHKFYSRDSVLFIKKVISESELDKTQMSYLSSKDALQNAYNNLIMLNKHLSRPKANYGN
jgi:multidrug efflux pump subunit AcrA (membrane-fusion protein)